MCGICGAISLDGRLDLEPGAVERMIGAMRNRGPDEFGAWRDEAAVLGHARLSIIDLETGQQPLANGDGRFWITFNGEVFNYIELARELEGLGHVLRTRSDTEVVVHAYEEWGEACVERFNGQYAFAVWDRSERTLFLARDRFGICPLFVTEHDGKLLFASEVKALAGWPGLRPAVDGARLAEVFTYWVNIAPATPFAGIAQLPPGHTATARIGRAPAAPRDGLPASLNARRYWAPSFLPADEDRRRVAPDERRRLAAAVRERLESAAALRLRADVPVGAFLSGGLDSTAIGALVRSHTDGRPASYSLGFADERFDERDWQTAAADHLGTRHDTVVVEGDAVARDFRRTVWHSETALLRTAPVPLLSLSGLVRSRGTKVVLTGEGADEVFVGYNIFREAKVRRFWSRDPESERRFLLLTRLYPYLRQSPPAFLRRFYGQGLDETGDAFFSHRPRWRNTAAAAGFLAADLGVDETVAAAERRLAASLPDAFATWGPVARAQYLEMTTFMAGYLLCSQSDRVLMGNSVEGRYPFLDHEVADLAGSIPASVKLDSLAEKALLKESVADLVPEAILARPKQPYNAPAGASFDDPAGRALVAELLEEDGPGWETWQRDKVRALVGKWRAGRLSGVRDNLAFTGVLSGRSLQWDFGPGLTDRLHSSRLTADELVWRS